MTATHPLNILRVADVSNRPGGMTRAMYGTGDVLSAQGHRVDYLFSEDLPSNVGLRYRRFTIPLLVPRIIRQRQAEGRRYDVVEIHEPIAAGYCWQRAIGADLPPLVLFSHGIEARSHRCRREYRRQHGERVTWRERLLPKSVIWQAMYALRRADHVICLNTFDEQFLIDRGISKDAITLLNNGVDPEFLQAGAAAIAGGARGASALFLGTWIERKGVPDLVRAVSLVMDSAPDFKLTIAGYGFPDDVVLDSFEPRHRQRIRLVASVRGNAALAALYAEHSMLLLFSYFEGQPLVMLEAAAMGLAIVATDTAGMHDFLADGRGGILVPIGEPAAIAHAINEIVFDASRRESLGRAAFEKTKSFTWANSASTTLAAYRKAIGRATERS